MPIRSVSHIFAITLDTKPCSSLLLRLSLSLVLWLASEEELVIVDGPEVCLAGINARRSMKSAAMMAER